VTLLTTRRMPPELVARIEASVRGTRSAHRHARTRESWRPRIIAVTRIAVVAGVFTLLATVLRHRADADNHVDRVRASLLETVRAATATLTDRDVEAESRMESWIVRASGGYESDFVAERLRQPGALAATLERGSVYVRGTVDDLHTSRGIRDAAAASVKDALLSCLLAPPSASNESALVSRVHDAYAGGAGRLATQVERLHDVQTGLPFLQPSWAAQVRESKTLAELDGLGRAFEKAPIAAARSGLKAALLIFAIDEPGDTATPAELDGERAHDVRVGLVDLVSDTVLLRLRRHVDPAKISVKQRSLYASGIDACALAMDVRRSVE